MVGPPLLLEHRGRLVEDLAERQALMAAIDRHDPLISFRVPRLRQGSLYSGWRGEHSQTTNGP